MSIIDWRHPFGCLIWAVAILTLGYIVLPLIIIVASSFGGTGFLAFPPHDLSLRWYRNLLVSPQYLTGFLISVRLAGLVTLISLAIGVPAAYGLVWHPFRGSTTLTGLFMSPLMLPGLVLAVALTVFFSHWPVVTGNGRLVLAHLTICVPCVMRVAIPAFEKLDPALEEAARNLGASPARAFFLVALPTVRLGLVAAGTLAFIMSFDEVDMAVFISDPGHVPLTVVLFTAAQLSFDPTLAAAASCLILIVFALMLAVHFTMARK